MRGAGGITRGCLSSLGAAALLLATGGPAQAYELLPAKWGKRTLTYGNTSKYGSEVNEAARIWNRSGVRFRWKPARPSRADVPIRTRRNLFAAGLATSSISNGRFTSGKIDLRHDLGAGFPTRAHKRAIAIGVIVHEMGHVMGLDHDNGRCAVMNVPLLGRCGQPQEPWRFRCRALEADDVRGAVRLYGGRVRKLPAPHCDLVAPPAAPTDLAVAVGVQGEANVSWRTPAGAQRVRILRRRDTCPTGLTDEEATLVDEVAAKPGTVQTSVDYPQEPGRYCYLVGAIARFERPGRVATRFHDHPSSAPSAPPVASFTYFEDDGSNPYSIQFENNSADDGAIVAFHWDFGDGTTSDEIEPQHVYAAGGSYEVTLAVTDDQGNTDTFTVTVEVSDPQPPSG